MSSGSPGSRLWTIPLGSKPDFASNACMGRLDALVDVNSRVLFILAGRIAGEHRAGAYDTSRGDLKSRDETLPAWLAEMRF